MTRVARLTAVAHTVANNAALRIHADYKEGNAAIVYSARAISSQIPEQAKNEHTNDRPGYAPISGPSGKISI